MQQPNNQVASIGLNCAEIEALHEVLPATLRGLLIRRGRSIFRNGRIQLCHPQDLAMVMDQILAHDVDLAPSDTHAYAYSAFGTIYFVHGLHGAGQIDLLNGTILCKRLAEGPSSSCDIGQSATTPFRLPDDTLDLISHEGQPLFDAATLKHGALDVGQCFGFFPALGMGGIAHLDSLQAVNAPIHFSILAQLADFQLVREDSNGKLSPVTRRPSLPTPHQIVTRLSPECPFRIVRYAEIADEVPEDSIYSSRRQPAEKLDELVLLADGDLILDTLDLDDPLAPWRNGNIGEHAWFIFVRGNMTITRHIHSLETDGACGLIVSGDLTTTNAIVGGQEIRVGGNLRVHELFWGDYNHGRLHVVGSTEAALFIQTDYCVELDGPIQFLRRIDDVEAMDGDELAQLIEPDCLFKEDAHPDSSWSLSAETIVERLKSGKGVIRRQGLSAADPLLCTLNLFGDTNVSPVNFLRVCGEDMLPMETRDYQFIRSGISLYVQVDTEHPEAAAYMVQMEDLSQRIGARFVMEHVETDVGVIDRLMGRRPGKSWGLWKYVCNDTSQDKAEWRQVEANEIQPPHVALVLEGWRFLQEGASSRHWTTQIISPQDIRHLLALAICQPYDDYDDEDRCGFWVGHCHAAFRQQKSAPATEEPILRLSQELHQPNGTSVIESYYYDIETCMDGKERVRIRHKADQDAEEAPVQIDPVGGPELAAALRLFKLGAREMRRTNAKLLDGETPWFADEDAFAMDYWKQQGYLTR